MGYILLLSLFALTGFTFFNHKRKARQNKRRERILNRQRELLHGKDYAGKIKAKQGKS